MSLRSKRKKYYIVKDGMTLELCNGVVQDPSSGTMSRLSFFYEHKDGAVHINFDDVVKEMRMKHPQEVKSRLSIAMDPSREVAFPVSVGNRLIDEVRTLTKSLMTMGRLLHNRLLNVGSPLLPGGSSRRKLIDYDITALQTKLRQLEEKERKAMADSPSKVKYKSLIGREITIDDERMDLISNFARHHTDFIEYRGRRNVSPDTFDKDINYCNKFLYKITPMVVIEMQDLVGMMEQINEYENQADDKRIFAANLGLIDIKLKEFMEHSPRQSRRIGNQQKKRTLFTNKSFVSQHLSSSESSDAEIREIPRVQTSPLPKQNVVKRTELAKKQLASRPTRSKNDGTFLMIDEEQRTIPMTDTMFHDKEDKKKQKPSNKSFEKPNNVIDSDTSSDKSSDISFKAQTPPPPKQNVVKRTELAKKQPTPRPTRSRNDGSFLMIDEEKRVIPMPDTMFHDKEDKKKQKPSNKSFEKRNNVIYSDTSSDKSSDISFKTDTMFHDKEDKKKQTSKTSSEIFAIGIDSNTSSDKSSDTSFKVQTPRSSNRNVVKRSKLAKEQPTPRPTRSRSDGTFLMIDEENRIIPMTETMFHDKEDKKKQKSSNKSFEKSGGLFDPDKSSNSSLKKRKRKNEEKENQSRKITVEADIEVNKTSQEGSRIKPIAKSTSILSVIPHTQKSAKVNRGLSSKALNEIRILSTDSDCDFVPNKIVSSLEKRSITYHSSSDSNSDYNDKPNKIVSSLEKRSITYHSSSDSNSDYNDKHSKKKLNTSILLGSSSSSSDTDFETSRKRPRRSNSAASGRSLSRISNEGSEKRSRGLNSSISPEESPETNQRAPKKIINLTPKHKSPTHSTPMEEPKKNKSSFEDINPKPKKQFNIKRQFGQHSFDRMMQKDPSQVDRHPRRSLAVNNYAEKKTKSPYKVYEDRIILAWVMKGKNSIRVNGNVIWKELEDRKFTTVDQTVRTWQSLKNRFQKHILPNLRDYGLKYDEEKSLRMAAAKGTLIRKLPSVAKKSVPGFSPRNKSSTSRGDDAISDPYSIYEVECSDSDDPITYKEFKRLSTESKGKRRRTLFTDAGFISQ